MWIKEWYSVLDLLPKTDKDCWFIVLANGLKTANPTQDGTYTCMNFPWGILTVLNNLFWFIVLEGSDHGLLACALGKDGVPKKPILPDWFLL